MKNVNKKKSMKIKKNSVLMQRKIFSILLSIIFITTVFSSLSYAKSENNKLIDNVYDKISEKISDLYTKFSENNNDNKPGGFIKKIINFITNRSRDRKEILPLHVVTNYNGNEKITKMKLFTPTSIDVDGDKDYDIRVWCFRTPAIDLKPPAIATKMTLIVRRLPGMENIKNELFEIYLEYYPRIITKFFYLTQSIDIVRIGYQSPVGGEVPKTFILTDKTVPHLIYPKLKTTHRLSVNPGSATGKHPISLILSFINQQDSTYLKSKGYAELKVMVNYSPAVKIKEITFNRNKDKLIGKGQTLEIIRNEKPSNVTFIYNQETDYFDENKIDESSSSTFTIGDIPGHMEISWSLGKNGYLEINTNNEDMGYFKASINNAILFAFDPLTETHIRIGWENKTLKNYLSNFPLHVFDLSVDVYNSVELKDFYLALINFSQNLYDESENKIPVIETTASHLILNLNSSAKVGNYATQYFLFPILPGLFMATYIDWHLENLQIKAYNLTFDVEYLQNSSEPLVDNISNSHASIKYLDFYSKKSSLSIDLINGTLSASGGGNIDIREFNFIGKNTRTSISYLTSHLSTSMYIISRSITAISISADGFLEIANISYSKSNSSVGISSLRIDLIKLTGDFSANIQVDPLGSIPPVINGTGNGCLEVKNLNVLKSPGIKFDFSFSLLNISSCPPGSTYFAVTLDSSSNTTGSIIINNGLLEIANIYFSWSNDSIFEIDLIKLTGDFSANIKVDIGDKNISVIDGTGSGYLEIKNLHIYNNYEYHEDEIIELEFKFSLLNISSCAPGSTYFKMIFDSSFDKNHSIIINNGLLQIMDLNYRLYNASSNLGILKIDSIKLFRDFSLNIRTQTIDDNTSSIMINSNGEGYLEINELYNYNNQYYYDYKTEFKISYFNLSSYPSSNVYSALEFGYSLINTNRSFIIENGFLEIRNISYRGYDQESDLIRLEIDLIKLYHNFLFNTFTQRINDSRIYRESFNGDGSLEIDNLYIYINDKDYSDEYEFSFSYLNLSSYPSSIAHSVITFNSSGNENLSLSISNGLLILEDLYYSADWDDLATRVYRIDFINASKNLFLNFESISSFYSYYLTKISADGDGNLRVRNFHFEEGDAYLDIDLFNKSGDSTFSLFFPLDENGEMTENIYDISHLDGIVEVSGVRSSDPYVDALEYLYIDGNGNLKIQPWRDPDTNDYHIYLESQNGLKLNLFSIELDNGIKYHIERQGTMEGYIGPGFLHLGVDLNGDGDGFIFIDSSYIEFEDLLITYKSSIINKGIRFTPNIQSFDADSFLLQWDSFTLNNENHTVIPYNWYKTGHLLSLDFEIGILNYDNYYQLWPRDNLDGENQELDESEYLYNEGTQQQPLETGPPKPQKPAGPYGGIVIGRIVKGKSYTFSTLNNDIDQLLSYRWDWGDGTYSEWSPYLPSGVGVTGTHTWDQIGIYSIRVKAKNINGEESSWSNPHTITVRIKLSDDEQNNNQNNELVEKNQNINQGQQNNS